MDCSLCCCFDAGKCISISCIRTIGCKFDLKCISGNGQAFAGSCCSGVLCNLRVIAVVDIDIIVIVFHASLAIKSNRQRYRTRISKGLSFIQVVAVIMTTLRIEATVNSNHIRFFFMNIYREYRCNTLECHRNCLVPCCGHIYFSNIIKGRNYRNLFPVMSLQRQTCQIKCFTGKVVTFSW